VSARRRASDASISGKDDRTRPHAAQPADVRRASASARDRERLQDIVQDDRSGRHASALSGRVPTTATASESERKPAAAVEHLLIVMSVAEWTPSPLGRPSGHARPARGRRGAGARRHAIRLLDIGVRPEAPWSSSTSSRRRARARRPVRLAFYMGYCADRWEDPVIACVRPPGEP
jgi:hypothetical protein